jgi:hypothetical protein
MGKEDMLQKRVERKPNIIVRKEKNCYLLVSRQSGTVLAINNIGLDAWNLLTGVPVMTVIKKLAEKYTVEFEECKEEIVKFLEKLVENNLIILC